MEISGNERTVKKLLGDGKSAQIRTALEKDHAIICLMLLYMGKGKWKEAKEFVKTNGGSICDGTFRARMIELELLGLAKSVQLDPAKKRYVATDLGLQVAELLLGFFGKLPTTGMLLKSEAEPIRTN